MPRAPAVCLLGCAVVLAPRAAARSSLDEQALLQSLARTSARDSPEIPQLSSQAAFEEAYAEEGWAEQIYGPDALHPHLDQSRLRRHVGVSTAANLKRRLILHHIWKVGGTHLCDVARDSGLRVPENPGCHRWEHDDVVKEDKWRPCAVDPRLSSIPFDVVGHECGVDAGWIAEGKSAGFAWIGMIRDPVQQAYSWFAHAKRGSQPQETFTQWVQECNKTAPCGFYTFVPNLQTAWLAGGHCSHDPEQEGCVETALANLKSMAVVLEQDGSRTKGLEKLKALGWTAKDESAGTFKSESEELLHNATAEELVMVKRLQGADIRLLRAARDEGLI